MKHFLHFERITILISILFVVKFMVTGELFYIIHPRYFWLVYVSAVILIVIFFLNPRSDTIPLYKKYRLGLISGIMVFSLITSLSPLSSSASQQKNLEGVSNIEDYKRNKKRTSFSFNTLDRTLSDWVLLMNIDPEPNRYIGKSAKVEGFYHVDQSGTAMVARYVVSCCAADARIIGIEFSNRLEIYKPDDWIEVEGVFEVVAEEEERKIRLKVDKHTSKKIPQNPYVTSY